MTRARGPGRESSTDPPPPSEFRTAGAGKEVSASRRGGYPGSVSVCGYRKRRVRFRTCEVLMEQMEERKALLFPPRRGIRRAYCLGIGQRTMKSEAGKPGLADGLRGAERSAGRDSGAEIPGRCSTGLPAENCPVCECGLSERGSPYRGKRTGYPYWLSRTVWSIRR